MHLTTHEPARVLPMDPAACAARDIELAITDLAVQVRQAPDVTRALRLYHTATTLRAELERVIDQALNRADALCGR